MANPRKTSKSKKKSQTSKAFPTLNKDQTAFRQFLLDTGHIESPFNNDSGFDPDKDDIRKLGPKDQLFKDATRSWQQIEGNLDLLVPTLHGRELNADGDAGPASFLGSKIPRCGEKDYKANSENVAMAFGSGNWKGCHGRNGIHCVNIKVTNSPPSFLAPLWDKVKERVTTAFAEVGLLVLWNAPGEKGDTTLTFVNQSDGWIGLAIVSNNSTCSSSPIWLRLLSTYRGGSSETAIITQWTTLVKHELCHNCGIGHLRGGVQNPSLINGLPVSFREDPLWNPLSQRFSGVAVDVTPDRRKLVLAWESGNGTLTKWRDVKPIANPFPV